MPEGTPRHLGHYKPTRHTDTIYVLLTTLQMPISEKKAVFSIRTGMGVQQVSVYMNKGKLYSGLLLLTNDLLSCSFCSVYNSRDGT